MPWEKEIVYCGCAAPVRWKSSSFEKKLFLKALASKPIVTVGVVKILYVSAKVKELGRQISKSSSSQHRFNQCASILPITPKSD